MSDAIEVMAQTVRFVLYEDASDIDELDGSTIIAALHAAEKAGWRLVPVEGTEHQLNVLAEVYEERGDSFAYRETIQAAPRPWDEVER